MTQITFIGGGNMATSIIGGLLKEGDLHPNLITVTDPNAPQRQALADKFQVHTSDDNLTACQTADVIILAVKPQVVKAVLAPLATSLARRQPLIISIAAGINITSLEQWSQCRAVVRCMPNTPALLSLGASGLFANAGVSTQQRHFADTLMRSVGTTTWLQQESDLDAVTALSGSGPAYFFLLMEAMIEAGQAMGLSADTAQALTLQTALGASQMALAADVNVDELRRRVTSPNGTTDAALKSFASDHFTAIVASALNAAKARSEQLSQESSD